MNEKTFKKLNLALLNALKKGNLEGIQSSLAQGAIFEFSTCLTALAQDSNLNLIQDPFIYNLLNSFEESFVFNSLLMDAVDNNAHSIIDYIVCHWQKHLKESSFSDCLISSIYSGNLALTKKFLHLGADINVDDGKALRSSIELNLPSIFHYLLEQGVDKNSINDALEMACSYGHIEFFHVLFKLSDDIHFDNDSLLSSAVYSDNSYLIQFLLNQDFDINSTHYQDCLLLFYAFEFNKLSSFQYLLPLYDDLIPFEQKIHKLKHITYKNELKEQSQHYNDYRDLCNFFISSNSLKTQYHSFIKYYQQYLSSKKFKNNLEQQFTQHNSSTIENKKIKI